MANIKKRDFVDQSTKISVKIIEECNDITELLSYKIEIDGSSASAQMQIDTAKSKIHSDGEYSDPEWWAKVNGYKRMLGFLSQKIQFRIRELNQEKTYSIQHLFMDVAREMLSHEQFHEIFQQAKLMRLQKQGSSKIPPAATTEKID